MLPQGAKEEAPGMLANKFPSTKTDHIVPTHVIRNLTSGHQRDSTHFNREVIRNSQTSKKQDAGGMNETLRIATPAL